MTVHKAPRQVGSHREMLSVDDVAHAAYGLGNEERRRCYVGQCAGGEVPEPGVHIPFQVALGYPLSHQAF